MSAKQKRGIAKMCLTRAVEFVSTINSTVSVEMLEIRLRRVEDAWSEFCSNHYDCLKEIEEDFLQPFNEEFSVYETKYFEAHAGLKTAIRAKQAASSSTTDLNSSVLEKIANQQSDFLKGLDSSSKVCDKINLPPIVIPKFSGEYKDWPSFRDSFLGSVDRNKTLSPTHKFHYLKSFLSGTAADLIQHIKVSDANYTEAWDRLERRFDRGNLIVQSFVQTFLSLPSITVANASTLRKITDGADEVIRGLNALGKNSRDPWLIHILLGKLDSDTKHAWAKEIGTREDSSIQQLIDFLETRCNALEACQPLNRLSTTRGKQTGQIRALVAKRPEIDLQCRLCKGPHQLYQCAQFLELDISSRRNFTKTNSICYCCLRPGHSSSKCKSSYRCNICKARHHRLVHQNEPTSSSPAPVSALPSLPSTSSSSCGVDASAVAPLISNHSLQLNNHVQTVLPTILAKVKNKWGQLIDIRALLDTGSQSSFISEACAQKLGLSRTHARIPVSGLGSTKAGCTKGYVSVLLLSRYDSSQLPVDAFVLGKLTSNLPSSSFDASTWEYIRQLELADPTFNISSAVDMILGAGKVWSLLKSERVFGPHGTPIAQNTSFGWVISGELIGSELQNELSVFHGSVDLDALLQRFWQLEEVPPQDSGTILNDPAEKHFVETFSRATDGKYVVRLPFKTSDPKFAGTLQSAVSRLHSMERRFRNNPELKDNYAKFMDEYLDLGHMEPIPRDEIYKDPSRQYYLPHHAVFKPDSSTTKLRVVFDGSVKDLDGKSLNSQLLIGPAIQRDLIGVCLRFRQHLFVFTSDIVKMFRQIWVADQDLDYQRIVWRQSPNQEMKHYRLKTVTYGTASAPFLSVRVLQQIASDYQTEYPNASRVLLNDVYVDDIMTGANSVEDLLQLKSDLVVLLSKACLNLRKWSSNCWALLAQENADDCEYSFVDPERSPVLIKVLGMFWNPAADVFSYRLTLNKPCPPLTRRTLLSEISRIFDPLGLLAPSVVLFKIMFQKLWSAELNLGWDDPLPAELSAEWENYRDQLPYFERIQVPRTIYSYEGEIELHGFCDASSLAYAAVIYARLKPNNGETRMTIVAAKTKVAPVKPISIPRLELCGALLLVRLIALVRSSLTVKINRIFAWCDSEVVLHWLSSPPRRWTTFVANRTAAILETVPRHCWRYVPSKSNPADCASRGVPPSNLFSHSLWWSGPNWLSQSEEHWPNSNLSSNLAKEECVKREERSVAIRVLVTSHEGHIVDELIERVSSWFRLQRVVAYVLRFVLSLKSSTHRQLSYGLTSGELRKGKVTILRRVQQSFFGDDICYLNTTQQLPPKSKFLKYSAFLDEDGLLRIGGRLKHACVPFNIKHPIILPKTSRVSKLIITDIHQRYMHAGVSETFAFVRQEFWIMGSRNLIRRIVHECKRCFMQRRNATQQIMGDLPSHRIEPSRPFSNSGCDYAGPLTIKLSRCRNAKTSKAYIALFVCLSTKAIHLELVGDLTTDSFIAALRRFVSRRGKCTNIYSDNGTNFQGARRCLTEMHKLVMRQTHNDVITAALAKDGINWHFIPPSSPHFGGLWEAGVKSVKLHLRRVVGNAVLTFEELCTVLTQIEAILNSRPLCPISDVDLNPLTPAHFLIGEPLTAVPEPANIDVPINRLSRWSHVQKMVQGFWKRWHNEYLSTLQERPKWRRQTTNFKPGDLVVIKEPNTPPTKWILGRIDSVSPGADNIVRVVSVRTATGTFVRPITKLALLPMS